MLSVYHPAPARRVVDTALAEWAREVGEPGGPSSNRARIDHYIRGEQGLSWTWLDPYRRDGDFAWCGAFVAHCWGAAGLARAVRREHLASTYRIERWARGTRRFLSVAQQLLPGDIVVLERPGGKRWGDHMAICERVELSTGEIHTIEGNAFGRGPRGALIDGVVRCVRPLIADHADKVLSFAWGIRPLAFDLVTR